MKSKSVSIKKKLHVKQGDTVKIITGVNKGKVGKILQIFSKTGLVIVEGVNIKTKNQKPRQEGEAGKTIKKEAPVDSSNVMLYSEKTKIASRIAFTENDKCNKVRYLIKNQEKIN